jgi:hypothetical protein
MKVVHEPDKKRFVVKLGAYDANLMYAEKCPVLDFYHVYVPDPYRGRGIAESILNFAFQYATEHNYKVVPSCPFIAGEYLPRHSEFQGLIEKDQFPFSETQ